MSNVKSIKQRATAYHQRQSYNSTGAEKHYKAGAQAVLKDIDNVFKRNDPYSGHTYNRNVVKGILDLIDALEAE